MATIDAAAAIVSIGEPPADQIGLDGTTYHLELVSDWTIVEFGWWEENPAQWNGLRPIADGLIALVIDAIPQGETRDALLDLVANDAATSDGPSNDATSS